MKFTYAAYKELLQKLKENGYTITNYKNYKSYSKAAILRHDVDMSLEKAEEMAKIESERGIKATYYVLLCSDFYNIFSKKSLGYIQNILHLGHEIGLHFDEEKYSGDPEVLKHIEEEIFILERCIHKKVESVSMHRPSKETLEYNHIIKNGEVINSYGKEFFIEFKYISDSRKNWREDISQIIESDKYNKLHILTHPIWYEEREREMGEQLKDFCNNAVIERYDSLKENIRDCEKVLTIEDVLKT